jgi:hypothetical protein
MIPFIDLIYQDIVSNYYDYFDRLIQSVINLKETNLILPAFAKIFYRIPLPVKIKMVENCLYKKALIIAKGAHSEQKMLPSISSVQTAPKGLALLQVPIPTLTQVDSMIIEIPEPIRSLEQIQKILADRSRTKKLKRSELESIQKGDIGSPIIYIHILYNIIKDTTSCAIAAKTGRDGRIIRVLNPNETLGWRNAEKHEYYVYEHLLELEFKKFREKYEKHDYYGRIFLDDKFHVVEKSQTGRVNYGRVCYEDTAIRIIEAYLNICRSLNAE